MRPLTARITVTQTPEGHIVMSGEGDFDFEEHKDSLIAKATIAGADAINAVIQESASFERPIITGEKSAIEMSEMRNQGRVVPTPRASTGPTSTSKTRWYHDVKGEG